MSSYSSFRAPEEVRTIQIGGGNITEPLVIRRAMQEHRSGGRLEWGRCGVQKICVLLSVAMGGGYLLVLVGSGSTLLENSCFWVVRAAARARAYHLRLPLRRSLALLHLFSFKLCVARTQSDTASSSGKPGAPLFSTTRESINNRSNQQETAHMRTIS